MSKFIHSYYTEGKEAFLSGDIAATDNPYGEQSAAGISWEAGYSDAWYDSNFTGRT